MSSMNIPIFIPHYGCPNGCVFCNQKKISGKDDIENEASIRRFIEDSLMSGKAKRDIEIAFFGGSFTGLDYKIQRAYLDIAKEYVIKHKLKGIRMSTRPDYISSEIMQLLKDYPVSSIELGVQSLDNEVLIASKRNHSIEDVKNAVVLIKEAGISLGLQMMIGLPMDTLEKSLLTAKAMIRFEPDTIRIYPTLVLEETELCTMYYSGAYSPLTIDESVHWVSKILPLFQKAHINVIRVGLQSNEGLSNGMVITGPYHPAFKELVLDEIVFKNFIEVIEPFIMKVNRISKAETNQEKKVIGKSMGTAETHSILHEDTYILNSVFELGNTTISIKHTFLGIEIYGEKKILQRMYGHKKGNYKRLQAYFKQRLLMPVEIFLIEY